MASKRKQADLRDELLDVLGENGEKLRELQEENARIVDRLRELGASWTEIGQAVGATRQATRKRYSGGAEEFIAERARGRTE
ncbi:hypothetical protein BH10ACT3_BH10ACT3_06400 [soil metagenome]